MKKTFVFKKQFLGNRFVQVLEQEEYELLDSDDFYNVLHVVDTEECDIFVYVPIILGTAEQVRDEFISWLEDVGKGLCSPV